MSWSTNFHMEEERQKKTRRRQMDQLTEHIRVRRVSSWKEQMLKLEIYCSEIVKNLWKQVVEYIVWQIAFLPNSSPHILNKEHMLLAPNLKLTWNVPWQILGHVAYAETRWRFINTQFHFTLLFSSQFCKDFHTLRFTRSLTNPLLGEERRLRTFMDHERMNFFPSLLRAVSEFKLKDEMKSFWTRLRHCALISCAASMLLWVSVLRAGGGEDDFQNSKKPVVFTKPSSHNTQEISAEVWRNMQNHWAASDSHTLFYVLHEILQSL